MKCKQCKGEIKIENVRFCPFCGFQLRPRSEERRNGIIVFADVSGFTRLSHTLDPDRLRELMDQLMTRFSADVQKWGGVIDKIIGDCILFVFGTEHARPDDPERAMAAIHDLRNEMKSFNDQHSLQLSLHFGASYGTVSVGSVGASTTVMGDPVNMASRLLQVAGGDQVVASKEFVDLLSADYIFEALPPVALKGFDGPVVPHKYIEKSRAALSRKKLVGRENEIQILSNRIDELVREKKGGKFFLFGSAGNGKTALCERAREIAAERGADILSLYFEEGGVGTLAPFLTLAQRILSTHALKKHPDLEIWAKALAEEQTRSEIGVEQLEIFLTQFIEHVLESRPLLFQTEDAHRAEASGLALLERLMKTFEEKPVIFLTTSRIASDKLGEPLEVAPLSEKDARHLVTNLLGDSGRSELLVDEIIPQCGGNPFVLHELARAIKRGVPKEKLFQGNIDFLLASSLDSLTPEDQELIKKASVLGSRIPAFPLAHLSEIEPERLQMRLAQTGLVTFLKNEKMFVFRHDLIREHAYRRINHTVRSQWHGKLGDYLARQESSAEETAYHYLLSGQRENALRWSLAAGRALSKLPGKDRALYFLECAQKLALELENAGSLRDALTSRFYVEARGRSVADALSILSQWFNDAHFVSRDGVSEQLCLIRAEFFFERGQYEEAIREIESLTEKAPQYAKPELGLLKGKIHAQLGHHAEVTRIALRALRNAEPNTDLTGNLYNLLGYVSYLDQEFQQASDFYQRAHAAFEKTEDLRGVQKALLNLGNLAFVRHDYSQARDRYLESIQIAYRFGDLVGYGGGLLRLAQVNYRRLKFSLAIANLKRAISLLQKGQNENLMHQCHLMLGTIAEYLGDFDGAENRLSRAQAYFDTAQDPYNKGRALAALGKLRFNQQRYPEAENAVEEAIRILGTYPNEIQRAELLLIQVLERSGRREEARRKLDLFKARHQGSKLDQVVESDFLCVESMLTGRQDSERRKHLLNFLDQTRTSAIRTDRLPLLVEALEYGLEERLLKEALCLADEIKSSFPHEYQMNFEKKGYFQRLRELSITWSQAKTTGEPPRQIA
ncbi:MAG TPA: adenylate/guanylate cyclase domain-containing protein [Bdellovibrionota bacterium]|nr:adenylate/guanylate cyclase domain-containing protein [Bdellovibrionota bacterium]